MTTDFRALCAELVQAFEEDLCDSSHGVFGLHLNGDLAPWDELIEGGRFKDWLEVFARARAALANEPAVPSALVDTHYEWELEDAAGEWQAGGSSNSQSDVEREGMHYLQTYAQDGPHKLIIRQHTTQTINEIANDH